MRTLLKGARLLDPASGLDEVGDLLLEDGRIAARGGDLDPKDCQVEDCRGWVAAPGLVDMHVHLRDPGQTHRRTCFPPAGPLRREASPACWPCPTPAPPWTTPVW